MNTQNEEIILSGVYSGHPSIQENGEFKSSLGYVMSCRPVYIARTPFNPKNKYRRKLTNVNNLGDSLVRHQY